MKNQNALKLLTILELTAAVIAVAFDLFIPALVILAVAGLSLLIRKEKFASLGFHKFPAKLPLTMLAWAVVWTLIDIGLFMPILNHLTGTVQDVSAFANLKGNLGQLVFMLVMSWTLAAFCEETAFRGLVGTRICSLFPNERAGRVAAVILTAVLFGFIHTEQGVIGVVISMLDGAFYGYLRYKYDNLWAAVFAHGFINSIGMIAFFFVGPITGLW